MKSLNMMLILLCSMLGQTIAYGQGITTAVYFSPGQSKLNDNALAELDSVLTLCQSFPDVALDIKAYTDDKGSELSNQKLSNRRAAEVFRFLREKGLNPNKKVINGLGEVALVDASNVEVEREKNRRVEISITPFAPENWEDYYSFFKQRNTQTFYVQNNQDNTIVGKKGTVLFIPKNSFQTADKKDIGNDLVEINLYEAYSYNDMLLQNLTTVSDGQILETGGMIHIEAKRKSDGVNLQLRPEQELQLTMPSSNTLAAGMQLFTADRDLQASGQAINWKTDGTKFLEMNLMKTIKISFDHFSELLRSQNKSAEAFDLPTINLKLLAQVPHEPIIRAMPKQTFKMPLAVKNFEDFKLLYPKKTGNSVRKKETTKKHNERLESLYRSALEMYERDSLKYVENWNNFMKLVEVHLADSISYDNRFADYSERLKIYELECDKVRTWVKENKTTLEQHYVELEQLSELAVNVDVVKKHFVFIKKLEQVKDVLKQEAQRAGLLSLMDSIENMNLDIMAVKKATVKLYSALKDLKVTLPKFAQKNYRYCDIGYQSNLGYTLNGVNGMNGGELVELYTFFEKVNKVVPDFQKISDRFQEFASDSALVSMLNYLDGLKEVNNRFEKENDYRRRVYSIQVWENKWYDNLSEVEQHKYDKLNFDNKEVFISDFTQKQIAVAREAKLKEMENSYLEFFTSDQKENYLPLDLTEKEAYMNNFIRNQFNQVENVVGIKSLGWINCDRFYNQTLVNFSVPELAQASENTKYYICFKNIRSVLPLYNSGKELTARVPANAQVQIIGLDLQNGHVALSSTVGMVAELNKKPLEAFKKVRMDELAAVIN